MKHSVVDALNRWIGEACGLLINGKPRFCWRWVPDMVYWQTRLPKCWAACYWGLPKWNEKQWNEEFGDRCPYPTSGMYHPYPEYCLKQGVLPNVEMTQNLIWAMRQQMSMSDWQHETDAVNEVSESRRKLYNEQRIEMQDWSPAFQNFTPGVVGGTHMSRMNDAYRKKAS
jgi:hypothetical protein